MIYLGWAAIMTALIIMSSFTANPWKLDLRKLMTAQAMFWLGMLALTIGSILGLAGRMIR